MQSNQIADLFKSRLQSSLLEIKQLNNMYVPTGLQEDIIVSVGCGRYQIIVAIDANRIGKTTAIINIAKQIMWPEDNEYFNFWEGDNIFKVWPFTSKRFRITGTPSNLADTGAIQQTIEQWWPAGKYERSKAGKHHYCVFQCGDWMGDALTYEQSATEYEGPTLSLVISDEPPKPALIGAINSRMAEGGIWVIGMTPINCGVFLDNMDDLQEKGKRIKILSGSVYENDVDTGKPNHNNTKRGLWTKEQIEDYVSGIPLDEQDARVRGIASHKSGKIFPWFDETIHVIDFDLNMLPYCNCYMSIDPHRKFYPAIIWYAVTPSGCIVVYNEWPKYDDMNAYYDEKRQTKHFEKSMDELANIILANDMSIQCGAEILSRSPDPYYDDVEEFVTKMITLGVAGWVIPDRERIEIQRTNLQELIKFNPNLPLCGINMPDFYVRNNNKNVIRSLYRHYWEDGKDKEAEEYKDFIDSIRAFLSNVNGRPLYTEPVKKELVMAESGLQSLAAYQLSMLPAQGYKLSPTRGK